jgi:hypothetical protein
MNDIDYLNVLVHDRRPVLFPDGTVVTPPPPPSFKASLAPIAIGLWAGYLFVLFCPGRKGSKALEERDLMQAYGGMMNLFSLV